jgi:hypothetical protein
MQQKSVTQKRAKKWFSQTTDYHDKPGNLQLKILTDKLLHSVTAQKHKFLTIKPLSPTPITGVTTCYPYFCVTR